MRDAWASFASAGAVVYGVNPSSESSHGRFAQKHTFPFALIVDQGARIARLYRSGLWLVVRPTVYVIGPDGVIVYARRGRPGPEELLAQLQIAPEHPGG